MGRGWEGGMDRVGESGGGKMKTTVFEHQEKKKWAEDLNRHFS